MSRKHWTRDDIIIAFALYCITPISQLKPNNSLLWEVARRRDLSAASLFLRMQNFRHMDPRAKGNKAGGMSHAGQIDRDIFDEFRHDWGALSLHAEQITGLTVFDADPVNGARPLSTLTDKNRVSRERHSFRAAVLAAYDYQCCISGLRLPALLTASHIKPYEKCRSVDDRTSPQNGLCLNVFYDKAFDQGYITVEPDYTVRVSPRVQEFAGDACIEAWLLGIEGQPILWSKKAPPNKAFLEYHNERIFKG